MAARGEGLNVMDANGEAVLIDRVAQALAKSPSGEPVTIVDCGANKGEWTELAKASFATATVPAAFHMMEPTPASRAFITNLFAGQTDVTIHPVALSDN